LYPYENATSIPVPGNLGVFIFFFISGYVVSKTCLHEVALTQSFSNRAFYIRRLLRIAPPLLVYVLTCLALGWLGVINFSGRHALGALTYTCNLSLLDCGAYGGHTWSLAFEEQFYLLFPLFFVWVHRSRKPNPLIVAPLAIVALLPFWFSIDWVGKTGFMVIYGLFGIGYLVANYEAFLTRMRVQPLLLVFATILTFLPVHLLGQTWITKYYKFVYLLSIPTMIFLSGRVLLPSAFLELSALRYVGRVSYSIYLWQQLFTGYFHNHSTGLQLAMIAVMIGGCALLYTFIEKPLISYGKRISEDFRKDHGERPKSTGSITDELQPETAIHREQ
jgi:peptidoglycan/LPS O-acetylase OafA/YrhL